MGPQLDQGVLENLEQTVCSTTVRNAMRPGQWARSGDSVVDLAEVVAAA